MAAVGNHLPSQGFGLGACFRESGKAEECQVGAGVDQLTGSGRRPGVH
jgi:hypothetical protein